MSVNGKVIAHGVDRDHRQHLRVRITSVAKDERSDVQRRARHGPRARPCAAKTPRPGPAGSRRSLSRESPCDDLEDDHFGASEVRRRAGPGPPSSACRPTRARTGRQGPSTRTRREAICGFMASSDDDVREQLVAGAVRRVEPAEVLHDERPDQGAHAVRGLHLEVGVAPELLDLGDADRASAPGGRTTCRAPARPPLALVEGGEGAIAGLGSCGRGPGAAFPGPVLGSTFSNCSSAARRDPPPTPTRVRAPVREAPTVDPPPCPREEGPAGRAASRRPPVRSPAREPSAGGDALARPRRARRVHGPWRAWLGARVKPGSAIAWAFWLPSGSRAGSSRPAAHRLDPRGSMRLRQPPMTRSARSTRCRERPASHPKASVSRASRNALVLAARALNDHGPGEAAVERARGARRPSSEDEVPRAHLQHGLSAQSRLLAVRADHADVRRARRTCHGHVRGDRDASAGPPGRARA